MPNETGDINKSESNFWRQDETGAAHLMAAFDLRSGNYLFPIPPSSLANLLKLEERELSTNGILYSYTVLHPHKKSSKPPFTLVFVDFPEGVRLMGRLQVPEGEHPIIGSELETIIEVSAEGVSDYVFRPVLKEPK